MKVDKLPTVFEMASYTFFVQQCVVGVFIEYRDYISWIEEKDEYKNVPSPVFESLKYLVYSLSVLSIYLVGNSFFPVTYAWDDEFLNESILYRLGYIHITWAIKRYFYYTPFMFQTGLVIACGLGYNG